MKNAWGTKRERINLWHSQFNKLFELWMCMLLMFFSEQQNLIKSKCGMHERTDVCIWFRIRCSSLHLNVRTITNTHSIFGGRWIGLSEYSSFEKFMIWKVTFKCAVCTVHCKWKGYKLLWWTAHNHISIDCLLLFVKCMHKSLCARTLTGTQYWRA